MPRHYGPQGTKFIVGRLLLSAAMAVALPTGLAWAQTGAQGAVPAAAPAEPDAIPLYGDKTPGSLDDEVWSRIRGVSLGVRNVTRPTLTPFLPAPGKANGAAVIVLPGGAFMRLALEWEGWRVGRALAERGVTAFVLKYRLIPTPRDEAEAARFMSEQMQQDLRGSQGTGLLERSPAVDDTHAALALVHARAAEWGIDPSRIGLLGYSAGAMAARRVALSPAAPRRPAFLGYIYGPQVAERVPADAPPLFNAIAFDDPLFPTSDFAIASAWKAAGRPVEVHGYQQGGHGFGLGLPGTTTALVMDQFIAWLGLQAPAKPAGGQ